MAAQEQKTVLIAISNPITSGRISTIMKEKGWICKKTSDGDETVDQYVKIKPEIVTDSKTQQKFIDYSVKPGIFKKFCI